MQILIFTIYLIVFTWISTRIPFNRKSGLSRYLIAGFFLYKVLFGCIYGWVHSLQPGYLTTMDTWKFFSDGLNETKFLLRDPAGFFSDLLWDPYENGKGRILSTSNSYWNDLKHNIMIKFSGLLNLMSGGNYYTNIILYNFLAFLGPMALYRSCVSIPGIPRKMLIAVCFLIPTTMFWTSGFHKEGLLLMSVCLIIFYTVKANINGWTIGRISLLLFLFFLIFILRNNVIFALAPAWLFWFVSVRFHTRTRLIFTLGIFFSVVVFFGSKWIIPKINLPEEVRQRQIEFMALGGNTFVSVDTLQADFPGFIEHLPAALDMVFLRPHPGEGSLFYIPFSIESIAVLSLLLLAIFKHKKNTEALAFIFFCSCYAVILNLLIGYTITNTGAMIRYRSVAIPFLVLAFIFQIQWPLFRNKKALFHIKE